MQINDLYSNISEKVYKASSSYASELEHFVQRPGECLKESYNFYTKNEKIKKDIASVVAAMSITNPIYARIETTVGKLPVIVSIKSRLISTVTGYAMVALGMGGRDRLRGKIGLSHKSSFLRKTLFDLGYIAGIIFPIIVSLFSNGLFYFPVDPRNPLRRKGSKYAG